MSTTQFPTSYEAVRAAIIAFMRAADKHLEKLHDRQLLKAEIERLSGNVMGIGTGLKDTGIHRPVDELGRIVIPKELRTTIGMDAGTSIEFFLDTDGTLILQPYRTEKCAICSYADTLTEIKGKFVCEDCIGKLFEGGE